MAPMANRHRRGMAGRYGCSGRVSRSDEDSSMRLSGKRMKSWRRRACPPAEMLHAHLIAAEALLSAGRHDEAEKRVALIATQLDARSMPAAWGEFLRVRAESQARRGETGRRVPRPCPEQQRVRAAGRSIRGRANAPRARPDGGARAAHARSDAAISIRRRQRFRRSAQPAISRMSRPPGRCWRVRARASSSARAWMETKRWCGASSTPQHFLNSWRARRCQPCRRPPAARSSCSS